MTGPVAPQSAGECCRAIEAYLCRENGGHLVRIVGPAFQAVAGWYAKGIPFGIVKQGIDRTVTRDRAKPNAGTRRPVRVEFCEADVLDAFDAWRRATGAGMAGARADAGATGNPPDTDAPSAPAGRGSRGPSLAAHVERAMRRLTQALLDVGRFAPDETAAVRAALEQALATLDALQAESRTARGGARTALIARLVDADAALTDALIAALPPDAARTLAGTARAELAPFAARMAAADLATAERAALARLVRERHRAPELAATGV